MFTTCKEAVSELIDNITRPVTLAAPPPPRSPHEKMSQRGPATLAPLKNVSLERVLATLALQPPRKKMSPERVFATLAPLPSCKNNVTRIRSAPNMF